MGVENGGDWDDVSFKTVSEYRDCLFPTLRDVFVLKNMSHYEVITKYFNEVIKNNLICNQKVEKIDY